MFRSTLPIIPAILQISLSHLSGFLPIDIWRSLEFHCSRGFLYFPSKNVEDTFSEGRVLLATYFKVTDRIKMSAIFVIAHISCDFIVLPLNQYIYNNLHLYVSPRIKRYLILGIPSILSRVSEHSVSYFTLVLRLGWIYSQSLVFFILIVYNDFSSCDKSFILC